VLKEAQEKGMKAIICNSCTEQNFPMVASLAKKYPGLVIPAFGIHPFHLKESSKDWVLNLEKQLTELPYSSIGKERFLTKIPIYSKNRGNWA